MCETGFKCPSCGQDLDQYEVRCIQVGNTYTRVYYCRPCGAEVTIRVVEMATM